MAFTQRQADPESLGHSIVTLAAPELNADQMVSSAVAEIAGISASTLRAYITRDEADVPLPQAVLNGRSMWARPVAEEWAEQRQCSPVGVIKAVAADRDGASLPPGVAEIWSRFTRVFFPCYGSDLRHASAGHCAGVPRQPSATSPKGSAGRSPPAWDRILPTDDLAKTIELAFMDELASGQELRRSGRNRELHLADAGDDVSYEITPGAARMLGWLVRHHPAAAGNVIGTIIGEAQRRLQIPRDVTGQSVSTALSLDGGLDDDALDKFLSLVLPPRA